MQDDNNEDIIPKISALFMEDNHSAAGLTGPLKTRGNSEVQLQGNPGCTLRKDMRQLTAVMFHNAGFGWI